jgi:aminotransferase
MKEEYDARRRIIVKGFNDIGLSCREPIGAFYAFPSIKSTGMTSEEFCEKLLYSKRVALVPGTAFGESGEGFVRASYCYSIEHIREALSRIGEFLSEIRQSK